MTAPPPPGPEVDVLGINALLPCPHCGSEPEHISTETTESVACMCGATMQGIAWSSIRVKWNTRAAPTRLQAPPAPEGLTATLSDALADARAGWRYVRQQYGDLSGVGWDRVETKLTDALASLAAAPPAPEDYAELEYRAARRALELNKPEEQKP